MGSEMCIRDRYGIANHRSSNYCFVAAPNYVFSWDVSNSSSPSIGHALNDSTNFDDSYAIKLDEANDVAFVARDNGITSVNISNANSMTVMDTATDGSSNTSVRDLAIDLDAGLAFAPSTDGDCLMVFDISDASNLSHISTFGTSSTLSKPRGVMYDPVAKVAYVSCWYGTTGNKLIALDCSNTSSLSVLGSVTTGNAPARGALNIGPREATNGEETG